MHQTESLQQPQSTEKRRRSAEDENEDLHGI